MIDNYILPFLWMKGETPDIMREEIAKIEECGIKAICLESRPHPDFMGEKWWADFEFILEEAKKRDMKIWILDDAHFPTGYANGLIKSKYPNRKKKYLHYNMVNVFGKKGPVTISVKQMQKPLISFLELDKPRDVEEQLKNTLVAVVAYPIRGAKKLEEEQGIVLTEYVKEGMLTYTFPADNYCVYVIYETSTDGGNLDYINMMDKESVSTLIEAVYEPHYKHFKDEFGKTILGFFSDEPEIGNMGGFVSNTQIGNSKMPLPWSEQLQTKMVAIYGDKWCENIPFLWTESVQMNICPKVRYDFMNSVSSLYEENFSRQIGAWCSSHQVEYIGHVVEDDNLHGRLGNGSAHYFRAMKGQHMAGIDVIADQVTLGGGSYLRSGIFERSGDFFHYALGKLGASSGHLDPNKRGRTMCELFGASGWGTGVRDMKYILDHLLVRGINVLVPHAFSMAEYPDYDCPPHFYARGNNPQFKQFAQLMKYANRMCHLFSQGQHMANVAVLYHADSEWAGEAMLIQKPAKELLQHQIEFDFVSVDMLTNLMEWNGAVSKNGFSINGQLFTWLIVPYSAYLVEGLANFILKNPQIKVIFVDSYPKTIVGKEENSCEKIKSEVVPLEELGGYLQKNMQENLELDLLLTEPFKDLTYYHYRKETDCYMLQNESAHETFYGVVSLKLSEGAVYFDVLKERYYEIPAKIINGRYEIKLELAPGSSCVILDQKGDDYQTYECMSDQLKSCNQKTLLNDKWSYGLATAKQYPNFVSQGIMEEIQFVSEIAPNFSGHICYEREIQIEAMGERKFLEFEQAFEIVEVWMNDKKVDAVYVSPYVFEITEAVNIGKNELKVFVTTTLERDQKNYPDPFIMLDHKVMEATGLGKNIVLHW